NEELDIDREVLEHNKYNFTSGNEELRSSDIACIDNISITEKSCTLEMLEKMINESK
ncbi:8405_t:CDS:1, partial [Racocetra persica]